MLYGWADEVGVYETIRYWSRYVSSGLASGLCFVRMLIDYLNTDCGNMGFLFIFVVCLI